MTCKNRILEKAKKLRDETAAIALAVSDGRTPLIAKTFIGVTVSYAVSPIDLIPDFIPVLGYLDESIRTTAAAIVNERFEIKAEYDLRLSGLLHDSATAFGNSHLGLVYVAKLRQPGIIDKRSSGTGIRFSGIGEIRQNREKFDSRNRILIDHLTAF
ncbi:MAG: DUF1232 domain-containing protein [Chitinispirillaceae bacterium]|nr:DUF1232 domain-containing protein [Chitinispirillaceae bacterium]